MSALIEGPTRKFAVPSLGPDRAARRRWSLVGLALVLVAIAVGLARTLDLSPGTGEFRRPVAAVPWSVGLARSGACASARARLGADAGRELHYVRTIAAPVAELQASFYNPAADEVVVLSHRGEGARMRRDGAVLGEVSAPIVVASSLDGAVYDPRRGVALLVDQACIGAEVDPVTFAMRSVGRLAGNSRFATHCGAVGLAGDDGLQVVDTVRRERVLLSADAATQLRRISLELGVVDGLAWIPATDEWLVIDGLGRAAIVDAADRVLVPPGPIGGAPPLLGGGPLATPDATHVVCRTGEVWVCEGAGDRCNVYAPPGPPLDTCACL